MATASISLIRAQTEKVRPPRALWVPFALGRPLGSAEDPGFQTDVIRAAFAMLYTSDEPTIEDFPIEAPEEAGPGQWSCPLSLPSPDGDETLTGRLLAEVTRMRPWSAETRRSRGRSLFGASGATVEQVDEVARALAAMAETMQLSDGDSDTPTEAGSEVEWAFDHPLLARHLADDLRTFYHEAIAAQPGPGAPNHDALNEWIFGGTVLGETLQRVADRLTEDGGPAALLVRGLLIPEGHYRGGSAFPATAEFGSD